MMSFCPCDLMTCYTWRLWILQLVRRRVLSIQEPLWIASEWSLWSFGSLPWRLTRVIGRGLDVLSSRGIRWRRSLLSSISASLTGRTVVTTTRTGLPNPCLHEATGSILHFPLLYSLSSWSHCFPIWSDWLHRVKTVYCLASYCLPSWSLLPSCWQSTSFHFIAILTMACLV